MQIEYKTVGVTGVMDTSIKDGPGVVTAIVSVTGIKDNVNDVIEPGAYAESLAEITPKGAWHHDWTTPVSKTLEAVELMPGDPRLPATLPNKQPWPKEAGALLVKMQFNLETQRGREAHSDVLFFGDQQEWSIGYKVPEGGARHQKDSDGQTRYISRLKCYEYSPVLFGAMPAARTASVKDAQISFKSLMGADLDEFLAEVKELEVAAGFETKNSRMNRTSAYRYDTDDDADNEDDDDFDDEEKAMLRELGVTPQDLRQAITVMTKVLAVLDERKDDEGALALDEAADAAMVELEALSFDTTADAVASIVGLEDDQRAHLSELARQFDEAEDSEERDGLLSALEELLDEVEDEEAFDGLRVTARVAGDLGETAEGEKSSRHFGPEVKDLRGVTGRQARQKAYLLQLKADRPDVLAALEDFYSVGSGTRSLIREVKAGVHRAEEVNGGFTIDTKALAELSALATS